MAADSGSTSGIAVGDVAVMVVDGVLRFPFCWTEVLIEERSAGLDYRAMR
jgi:hypothetical protein